MIIKDLGALLRDIEKLHKIECKSNKKLAKIGIKGLSSYYFTSHVKDLFEQHGQRTTEDVTLSVFKDATHEHQTQILTSKLDDVLELLRHFDSFASSGIIASLMAHIDGLNKLAGEDQ